jgi:hypothetical protein
MFLGRPIAAETLQNLAGCIVDDVVLVFSFKVIVRAVKVTDGVIPLYDTAALLIQMGNVLVIMGIQDVHRPQNVLVPEGRPLVVVLQMIIRSEFGIGIQDPCVSQEAIDLIGIKCDLRCLGDFLEKFVQFQLMIDRLQEEISDPQRSGNRSHGFRGKNFLVKVYLYLHRDFAFF